MRILHRFHSKTPIITEKNKFQRLIARNKTNPTRCHEKAASRIAVKKYKAIRNLFLVKNHNSTPALNKTKLRQVR